MKPRILVTSAAGHTGTATVNNLLEKKFPVRAFVRRHDARSERLRRAGAEIFVGNLFSMADLRKALVDVQRAYFVPPLTPNLLHGSMLFALAAEEARLEVVALMSSWNPHPNHPAPLTREHWITNNIYRWMPTVDHIFVNPGIFAFTYFFGLPMAAHFGRLMLPFGEGLNAPPSNEDIGAVAAAVLVEPALHIGKSYRPTGPRLISGHDAAVAFSAVLGRDVRYQDVSTRMFIKVARAQGLFSTFEISLMRHFVEEVRGGTYSTGAPTDHVEQVTGRPAEDFETIARRYIQSPELVAPGLKVGSMIGALGLMFKTVLTRTPDFDRWESDRGQPSLDAPQLAHENEEWMAAATQTRLALLNP